jgi:hypothetical protein
MVIFPPFHQTRHVIDPTIAASSAQAAHNLGRGVIERSQSVCRRTSQVLANDARAIGILSPCVSRCAAIGLSDERMGAKFTLSFGLIARRKRFVVAWF